MPLRSHRPRTTSQPHFWRGGYPTSALLIAFCAGAVGLGGHSAHATVTTTGDTNPFNGPPAVDPWVLGGANLFVGNTGTGMLDILAGGMVSNNNGFIGSLLGSTGTVTVTGMGSLWDNNLDLFIGDFGTGTLTIADGGEVRNDFGLIGNEAGSTGTVTVTGVGSRWDNSRDLTIGNTGSGTLTIEAGGVVNNDDSTIGSFVGSMGTVTVTGAGSRWDNSGDLTIGNSGSGTLTVEAGGVVSANSASTASGGLGILNLDGGTLTTAIGLDHQGVLSGHGTVNGPVNHAVGATVAGDLGADFLVFNGAVTGAGNFGGNIRFNGSYSPGNSPAQTTFTGDTVFGPANTLVIELGGTTPGTEHDQIVVDGGSLALDGRLDVGLIDDITPSYTPVLGDQFDVITTASGGAVTGTFDRVLLPFVAAGLGWDTATTPGGVRLTVVSFVFGDLAQTPNQQAVAAALDTIAVAPTPEQEAVLGLLLGLNTAQGQNALEQISGQLHGTLGSASLQSIRHVNTQLSGRLRPGVRSNAAPPVAAGLRPEAGAGVSDLPSDAYAYRATGLDDPSGDLGLDDTGSSTLHGWALGYGLSSDVEAESNAAGFTQTAGGTLFGVEEAGDGGTRIGLYGGFGLTQVDLSGSAQDAEIDQYQLGVYLAHEDESHYYLGAGSVGYNEYDSTRPTGVGSVASADYSGNQATAYFERGVKLERGDWRLQPYAALSYIYLYQDSFTERGAGVLNLSVDSTDEHSLQSLLGIQAGRSLSDPMDAYAMDLEVRALWAHEFLETEREITATLGVGGPQLRSLGNELERDSGVLGTSLSLAVAEGVSLVVSYDAQFSSNQTTHSGSLGLRWDW